MENLSDKQIREICSKMTDEEIYNMAGGASRVYNICKNVVDRRNSEMTTTRRSGYMSPRKTQMYVGEYGGSPMYGGGCHTCGSPRSTTAYAEKYGGSPMYGGGHDSDWDSKYESLSPRSTRRYAHRYGGSPMYGGGFGDTLGAGALTGGGALAGFAVGGPIGGMVGSGIGGLASGAIMPGPKTPERLIGSAALGAAGGGLGGAFGGPLGAGLGGFAGGAVSQNIF